MIENILNYLFPNRKLKRELEIISRILYNHVNGRFVINDDELEKYSIRHLELHHLLLVGRINDNGK